jgi:dCTP deaminase
MILNDRQITEYAHLGMIKPFINKTQVDHTTKGLSHVGYDLSLGYQWAYHSSQYHRVLSVEDYKRPETFYTTLDAESYFLHPMHGVLAVSSEYLDIPNGVVGFVSNKSSWARWFIHQPFCILEPGWKGKVTLELVNISPYTLPLRAGWGIAQVIFLTGELAEQVYEGKYQNQQGVTLPRVAV